MTEDDVTAIYNTILTCMSWSIVLFVKCSVMFFSLKLNDFDSKYTKFKIFTTFKHV